MKKFALSCLILSWFLTNISAQTLASVQEVYQIFQVKCVSCHKNSAPAGGLDLEGVGSTPLLKAVNVASKLVNKNPTNSHATAQGNRLVYPGRPDRSFLFRKINGNFESTIANLHVNEGLPMPSYPQPAGDLTAIEKEIIRQWILFGAKTSGVQFPKNVVENWYNNNGIKSFPAGAPTAPAAGTGFQIKMGPFYLPPSGEVEYFQKYELALPNDVEVNRLDMKFSGSSHHFLMYNFTTTNGANLVPHGLRLNANHVDINLVGAVQEETDLRLPATTAFRWSKNFILDLNSHYINYSLDRALQCEVYVNVYTQPIGTAQQEMFATLLVNPSIPIPANGNTITHTKAEFQPLADSIYVWGLMGHTHKYGTGYKVWKRQPNGQKGELIYDAACFQGVPGCSSPYFDYRHIPMRYWEPKLLPIKWGHGIIHEATWQNTGSTAVNFGPTSDDEMQVLIAFYTQKQITVDASEPTDLLPAAVQCLPNPASDMVQFQFPDAVPQARLQVFDFAGRLVADQPTPNEVLHLNIQNWQSGVYFFRWQHQAGRFLKL